MSVFANGRSITHAGDGGTISAVAPDVCKTPSPGGPVPVPYPNIARSSDLTDGTKHVTIEGNSVAIEDAKLTTSTGDEAGTAGGGVVSAKTKGKMSWSSASPDVCFEGKGVIRFMEPTLHNGNSNNTFGIQEGEPGTANPDTPKCMHCGGDIDDANHQPIATDNESLMKQAANAKLSGHTKGGIQVGDGSPNFASSAGTTGARSTPKNFRTGKPIKITAADRDRWMTAKPPGHEPGNCVEQILLTKVFEKNGPPEKGTVIKMGISQVARGSKHDRIKKPVHKPKCATCKDLMIAMMCNQPEKS